MNDLAIAEAVTPTVSLESIVSVVCARVAPQWGLRDLVAVNPYLGHVGDGVLAAEERLQRCQQAAVLPTWAVLREAWRTGACTVEDIAAACNEDGTGDERRQQRILACLTDPTAETPASPHCRSIAAVLGDRTGSDWVRAVVEDLGRFLAARHDQGVGRWRWTAAGDLWSDWRLWMASDHSMQARGVRGAGAWIAALPASAAEARAQLMAHVALPESQIADYLGCLLGEMPGWAGWLRQRTWTGAPEDVRDVADLLTMRLAMDVVLRTRHPQGDCAPELPSPADVALTTDRKLRLTVVAALERAWRRTLLAGFAQQAKPQPRQPAVQAVFCIDVRSEGFRLELERADATIDTYGFAGFFAMPVAVGAADGHRPQCPVLLQPAATVDMAPGRGKGPIARVLASFRRSAVGGFAYMETAGLARGWSLLSGCLGRSEGVVRRDETAAIDLTSMPMDQRLSLLRGMLKNLGLSTPAARLVLLCGHDSTVANNPQAAALACGACGGHSGAVNARLAAALYNDAQLRHLLGVSAPSSDSVAIAAVHDTATDTVRVLDRAAVPASHQGDLQRLEQALSAAGAGQRARRAGGLVGLTSAGASSDQLCQQLHARCSDWAELRPEWGLAGNAAFIAAPRWMTAGRDLGGRCFLHSYEAERDADGSVLRLILTAPVVVASWINLQYWASSVDPQRLGSGTKAIHTVVGGIGVATGGNGDLAVGLPWQSVHDGVRSRHLPLRLQVFVAAAPERMDQVIAEHSHLRDLVEQSWIVLHALDPATGACRRRRAGGGWEVSHGKS